MSRPIPITDSTAYVGRYADEAKTSWPWWAVLLVCVVGGLAVVTSGRRR